MVNFLSRKSLTLISLLYTSFVILNWFGPADAALLKDIRVGEYDNFTRIVFELDGRSANPDIETRPSGQLLVTFNNAGVDLVRKIPVERSPHIKDIQIWQRKEGLSALLISNYSNIRIESFRLSRPPRFAVDIFPISEPAKENMAAPSAPLTSASEEVTPSPEKNNQFDSTAEKRAQSPAHGQAPTRNVESSPPEDKTLSPDEVDRNSPPPLTVENIQHPTPDKPTLDTEDASGTEKSFAPPAETDSSITKPAAEPTLPQPAPEPRIQTSAEVDRSDVSPVAVERDQPALPKQWLPESTKTNPTDVKNKPHSSQNRLQLYLVVTLVIITIVILLMLLLMLLTSRHRLLGDKTASKPSRRLKNQDRKIEVLNSRIREQFKRYDEA